jgi:SAM-dependent methyltransferase
VKPDSPQPDASPAWARFYNEVGGRFAVSVAPRIRELYERTETGQSNRSLLDVCCGTGQLARHFLDNGYRVTGIDLSEAMLHYARANAGDHLRRGRAKFICADASEFRLDREFGLATSTFDALNLLQSVDALRRCFRCVASAVVAKGLFIFDLMTKRGFWQDYNGQWVMDTENALYVYRSIYSGGEKATSRMVGFIRDDAGSWERFDEYRTPTFFDTGAVVETLLETGWKDVKVTSTDDLDEPASDTESLDRTFFIATA